MNVFGLPNVLLSRGLAGQQAVCVFCACLATSGGHAQAPSLEELQGDLSIFSGILGEALKLNDSGDLFGRRLGGISTTYLVTQGAIFEVRSPLANRRNRMGLASLSSAMQALQLQENPFLTMTRSMPIVSPDAKSQAVESANSDERYQRLRDQLANIDFSLVVNTAVQQATHSARALRALQGLDEATYNALFAEIEGLRKQINLGVSELRLLEAELNDRPIEAGELSTSTDGGAIDPLPVRVEELTQELNSIKEEALTLAADLKQRAARAEADFAAQWRQDLQSFEEALYATLCAYGETLSRIPADESLSFILQGLGDEPAGARRTDKVHIVSRADLSRCVVGEILSPELKSLSLSYTY